MVFRILEVNLFGRFLWWLWQISGLGRLTVQTFGTYVISLRHPNILTHHTCLLQFVVIMLRTYIYLKTLQKYKLVEHFSTCVISRRNGNFVRTQNLSNSNLCYHGPSASCKNYNCNIIFDWKCTLILFDSFWEYLYFFHPLTSTALI